MIGDPAPVGSKSPLSPADERFALFIAPRIARRALTAVKVIGEGRQTRIAERALVHALVMFRDINANRRPSR